MGIIITGMGIMGMGITIIMRAGMRMIMSIITTIRMIMGMGTTITRMITPSGDHDGSHNMRFPDRPEHFSVKAFRAAKAKIASTLCRREFYAAFPWPGLLYARISDLTVERGQRSFRRVDRAT
jgi:hypothetical protein